VHTGSAGTFGAYVALLALFHQLEYICVAATRPDTLSFDCESLWQQQHPLRHPLKHRAWDSLWPRHIRQLSCEPHAVAASRCGGAAGVCVHAVRWRCRRHAAFVLNHSTAYTVAAVTSWLEYALELWLVPAWKGWSVRPQAGAFD
jgi:hypothetical protein